MWWKRRKVQGLLSKDKEQVFVCLRVRPPIKDRRLPSRPPTARVSPKGARSTRKLGTATAATLRVV
jgi:hypothetical protein